MVDTQHLRLDRFGEAEGFTERALLIYSGIHYDALALLPYPTASASVDKTIFSTDDDDVLAMALSLANEAKQVG